MRAITIPVLLAICTFAVPAIAKVIIVEPGDKIIVAPAPQPVIHQSRIQIALLLDTSNSMDGLINQAKAQLWNIVNELSAARCAGKQPLLEVALFEYGNSRLAQGEGYIRQILPFSHDLDKLSEELFKLTTKGGKEYCGMVIQDALNGLQWSRSEADLKTIYIAGNEPFTQGPVDFHQSASLAMSKNILVNPIFCGPRATGIATSWQEGAVFTGGCYLS
ncbi:MAG: VWA domain-containing protein, partial [Phycisphaeraceae bacterium]|nr:VWA domain-containing protein [Phycisphaeraceae bacterium]